MSGNEMMNDNEQNQQSKPPIIAVQDITFGYKRKQSVLEHVSFDVPKGQSLAILGYNGVGKTTLFNLIVGLLRPWSGQAIINKRYVPSMRDVFEMTEQANMINSMTVRDNIKFRKLLFDNRKARKAGARTIDLATLEDQKLVQAFGIGEHLDKKVSDLSSGLRKRAGLVAGMLLDPHVIMLDEPTNSVDPLTRQLLVDYINQLRADGRTILTITHDLHYCWEVADRIIILDHKRLIADHMIVDFPTFEEFEKAATLGQEKTHVDFGIND